MKLYIEIGLWEFMLRNVLHGIFYVEFEMRTCTK